MGKQITFPSLQMVEEEPQPVVGERETEGVWHFGKYASSHFLAENKN